MTQDRITSYEDLKVWQAAMALVSQVYEAIRKLPPEERYDLGSQIRRAVVSGPANIAEGQARQHPREFVQCLYIARGSLGELETLLIVSQRLGYPRAEELASLQEALYNVRKPLHGLIARLRPPRPFAQLTTHNPQCS